jgi:hypothetical protein
VIIGKGEKDIDGLTNVKTPRARGPKRANRIRKLFGLPRHFDNIASKGASKVAIDRFDVTRYIVKKIKKTKAGREFVKVKSPLNRLLKSRDWLLPRDSEEKETARRRRLLAPRPHPRSSSPTSRNSKS